VANASGISAEDAVNNITIVRTLSAESKAEAGEDNIPAVQPEPEEAGGLPLPILIAIIAGGVLFLFLLLLLLLLRRKKKKKAAEEEELLAMPAGALGAAAEDGWSEGEAPNAAVASILEEEEETSQNEEIIKLKMQRNMKLKQNIGEMVDQNPQIVAKLVQGWLTSEEGGKNGGGRGSDKRK
jgi:flagellar M-ring protein FliF